MSRFIAVCILIASAVFVGAQSQEPVNSWPQEPSSFLGVKIGSPISASIPACPNIVIGGKSLPNPDAHDPVTGFLACYIADGNGAFEAVHMGSRIPFSNLYINELDGGVASIHTTFSSDRSDDIAKALIEKYGNPSHTALNRVTTKAGVSYDQRVLMWVGTSLIVTYKSLNDTSDAGSVTAMTKAFQVHILAKAEDAKNSYRNSF